MWSVGCIFAGALSWQHVINVQRWSTNVHYSPEIVRLMSCSACSRSLVLLMNPYGLVLPSSVTGVTHSRPGHHNVCDCVSLLIISSHQDMPHTGRGWSWSPAGVYNYNNIIVSHCCTMTLPSASVPRQHSSTDTLMTWIRACCPPNRNLYIYNDLRLWCCVHLLLFTNKCGNMCCYWCLCTTMSYILWCWSQSTASYWQQYMVTCSEWQTT